MSNILYQSKNILLRPILECDFDSLKQIWGDSDVMFSSISGIKSDDGIQKIISHSQQEFK